jgi:hypothetical protein
VLHSIGCEFEQWQHEALKIRDFHPTFRTSHKIIQEIAYD